MANRFTIGGNGIEIIRRLLISKSLKLLEAQSLLSSELTYTGCSIRAVYHIDVTEIDVF